MRGFTLCLSFGRKPTRVQFEFTPDQPADTDAEELAEVLAALSVADQVIEVEDCDVLYANRKLGF